jgi:hypothetical protein
MYAEATDGAFSIPFSWYLFRDMLGALERCGNRIKIAQRHQVSQLRFEQFEQSNGNSVYIQTDD